MEASLKNVVVGELFGIKAGEDALYKVKQLLFHLYEKVTEIMGKAVKNVKKKVVWTEEQKKSMSVWVGESKDRLGLKDWDVRVDFINKPLDGVHAQIQWWADQKRATVHLGTNFLKMTADDQVQTITHELLHCHSFAALAVPEHFVEAIDETVMSVLTSVLKSEIEKTTDALADVLAQYVDYWPGR